MEVDWVVFILLTKARQSKKMKDEYTTRAALHCTAPHMLCTHLLDVHLDVLEHGVGVQVHGHLVHKVESVANVDQRSWIG